MTLAEILREEGREEGLAKGRAEGIAEGARETAKKALLEGLDIRLIMKITGLSKQEVEDLAQQIK